MPKKKSIASGCVAFSPETTSFSADNALFLAKLCNIACQDQGPAQQLVQDNAAKLQKLFG